MQKISGMLACASLMMSLVSVVALNASAGAASVNCKDVAEDLKAMQSAQQSISESLISNHDVFADQMQDYSIILSTSSAMGQPVTKDAVTKMTSTSKSFRERGENARKLNKKLVAASDEVIARAISCLKK